MHSPTNGHLGCFHVLAIVNSAEIYGPSFQVPTVYCFQLMASWSNWILDYSCPSLNPNHNTIFLCLVKCRVSQSWHGWHLGLDNSLLQGAVLGIVGFSIIPGFYPLDASSTVSPCFCHLQALPHVHWGHTCAELRTPLYWTCGSCLSLILFSGHQFVLLPAYWKGRLGSTFTRPWLSDQEVYT